MEVRAGVMTVAATVDAAAIRGGGQAWSHEEARQAREEGGTLGSVHTVHRGWGRQRPQRA